MQFLSMKLSKTDGYMTFFAPEKNINHKNGALILLDIDGFDKITLAMVFAENWLTLKAP